LSKKIDIFSKKGSILSDLWDSPKGERFTKSGAFAIVRTLLGITNANGGSGDGWVKLVA
jgi:hypothetical protein